LPETAAARPAAPADAARAQPLFLRACRRERVERTPIWIMRQAGRYLPEYRALREKHDFLASCRTPELACEITLQPVRRLGVDAAILFSDILIPLPGMGIGVDFRPGPVLESTVRSQADVERLRVTDPREATGFVLDAVRLVRRELDGRVPLIGFAGAPFTMATYLVEGGGSKSFAAIKALLFGEPALAERLLGICAETAGRYLAAQVEAGAEAAMLFDTWAGLLSPADYRRFALPAARRAFEIVARAGDAPRIYYAGEPAGYLEAAGETGAEVIGLDWRLDLDAARRRLGGDVTLQGNLDPGALFAPPAEIRRRAEAVLRAALGDGAPPPGERPGSAVGHVFNLGHGILPTTPPEHAQALVDAVRELSERSPR
jgi:uroporphyrinogen decarboxylase